VGRDVEGIRGSGVDTCSVGKEHGKKIRESCEKMCGRQQRGKVREAGVSEK
jgi:hypothetical protein